MAKPKPVRTKDLGALFAEWSALIGSILVLSGLPFAVYLALRTPGRSQAYFLKLVVFTFFALYLAGRLVSRLERPRLDIPLLAIALGALFILLSAFNAPAPIYSIDAALPWFAGAALFVMLRAVARRVDLFRIYPWIFVLQAGPLAAYGIAQHYGYEILPYFDNFQKNRVISTFGHPNFFGSFMAPVVFICLARGLSRGFLPGRVLALAVIPICLYGMFLGRSRAAWIGVGLGIMVAAVSILVANRQRFGRPGQRRLALALLGGSLALALLAAAAMGPRRVERRLKRLVSGSQWETRLYFWYIAAGQHSPLPPTGLGVGGFARRFWADVDAVQLDRTGKYFRRNQVALTGWQRALDPGNVHNDYLEIWTESGWGALFAHLLLIAYLVYFFSLGTWRVGVVEGAPPGSIVRRSCLLGGFVAALFDAMLGFPLELPCSLAVFWFYCAMLNQYVDYPDR